MCMLHVHVCNMQVTKRPEEGIGSSRAGVTGGCEPNLRVVLGAKLRALEKQQAFLTAKPSPQAPCSLSKLCLTIVYRVEESLQDRREQLVTVKKNTKTNKQKTILLKYSVKYTFLNILLKYCYSQKWKEKDHQPKSPQPN